jgi:hypothetical protein
VGLSRPEQKSSFVQIRRIDLDDHLRLAVVAQAFLGRPSSRIWPEQAVFPARRATTTT